MQLFLVCLKFVIHLLVRARIIQIFLSILLWITNSRLFLTNSTSIVKPYINRTKVPPVDRHGIQQECDDEIARQRRHLSYKLIFLFLVMYDLLIS